MPSGKVHSRATIGVSLAYCVASLFLQRLDVFLWGVWALLGLLLSPDLDVDTGNISAYYVRKRAGNLASRLWVYFWFPYAGLGHRSFISHFPLVSTFGRLYYLWTWYCILTFILYQVGVISNGSLISNWKEAAILLLFNPNLFIGLTSSDLLHYIMDYIPYTGWKETK